MNSKNKQSLKSSIMDFICDNIGEELVYGDMYSLGGVEAICQKKLSKPVMKSLKSDQNFLKPQKEFIENLHQPITDNLRLALIRLKNGERS